MNVMISDNVIGFLLRMVQLVLP